MIAASRLRRRGAAADDRGGAISRGRGARARAGCERAPAGEWIGRHHVCSRASRRPRIQDQRQQHRNRSNRQPSRPSASSSRPRPSNDCFPRARTAVPSCPPRPDFARTAGRRPRLSPMNRPSYELSHAGAPGRSSSGTLYGILSVELLIGLGFLARSDGPSSGSYRPRVADRSTSATDSARGRSGRLDDPDPGTAACESGAGSSGRPAEAGPPRDRTGSGDGDDHVHVTFPRRGIRSAPVVMRARIRAARRALWPVSGRQPLRRRNSAGKLAPCSARAQDTCGRHGGSHRASTFTGVALHSAQHEMPAQDGERRLSAPIWIPESPAEVRLLRGEFLRSVCEGERVRILGITVERD